MAGSKVTGDIKTALKDLQADIISLKHETQTCIMDASMRKAILTQSEQDVREDIKQIRGKLDKMLKHIEMRAIMNLSNVVAGERNSINAEILSLEEVHRGPTGCKGRCQTNTGKLDKMLKHIDMRAMMNLSNVVDGERNAINAEILSLEEVHRGMEELEEYIKSKVSNISLKPLQEGREKCDVTKESLDKYKEKADKKGAQFVLHPLLTCILEQIEDFAMGDIVVRPKMDEVLEESDDVPKLASEPTNASIDPSKTSFMRSNSSKLIKLNSKEPKNDNSSRQNSAKSVSSQRTSKANSLSRQNSENAKENKQRRNSVSKNTSKMTNSSETQTMSPKSGIKRTLSEVDPNKKNIKGDRRNSGDKESPNEYRSIAGLKATITKRSATAPLINLTSPAKSTFAPISEDLPAPEMHYKETLEILKRDNNCYITGLALMPNGSIIVCDNVHDSLQLYNAELQQISELECRHPWAVTPVSDTAVAVTLHYDHKVVLIKAAEGLERLNEKDIVLKCQSALCFDVKFYEFRLYVLCMNSDIHVVDLKGREYNVIRTGFTPNTLKYIDVDVANKSVYTSGENGIACLDFRGLPLWHYKVQSKGKMLPTGILNLKGRVIFCDWANHCLKELFEDGVKVRTVFSETIEKPIAITASTNGDMVIFSQGDYDMDVDKSRFVKVLTVEPLKDE